MNHFSKSNRLLLRELGMEHIAQKLDDPNSEGNMENTLADLLKFPPSMVIAKVVTPLKMFYGGMNLPLEAGKQYVMPFGMYMSHRKDKTRTYLKPASSKFMDNFNRYKGEPLHNKKLLIWRYGGIGDLIFTQPLIKHIKKLYPTAHVTFATSPQNMDVFRAWNGVVSKVVPYPFEAEYMFEADYHITFEGSIERCKEAHTVNCYDLFARCANMEFDPRDYPITLHDNRDLTESLNESMRLSNVVAIQGRASSKIRSLGINKLIELCIEIHKAGYTPGVLDKLREAQNVAKFCQSMQQNHGIYVENLAAISNSLMHCISIVKLCKGIIGVDSSCIHLAQGLQTPAVGMYGAFCSDIRIKYYDNCDAVNVNESWNACGKCPCFFHDQQAQQCPFLINKQSVGCMSNVNVKLAVEKFTKLVEGSK